MIRRYALFGSLIFFLTGCPSPKSEVALTKDIVMFANLKNEKEAIKQYEYYHTEEGIWPEVVNAAKVSGMLKLKLYRFNNQLVMVINIPAEADETDIFRKYAESDKKLPEWDDFMITRFFGTVMQDGKEKTWARMKKVYHFENGELIDN